MVGEGQYRGDGGSQARRKGKRWVAGGGGGGLSHRQIVSRLKSWSILPVVGVVCKGVGGRMWGKIVPSYRMTYNI